MPEIAFPLLMIVASNILTVVLLKIQYLFVPRKDSVTIGLSSEGDVYILVGGVPIAKVTRESFLEAAEGVKAAGEKQNART